MLDYFEKFYIGEIAENKVDRKICFFPILTWNCFDRVLSGAQLSNNMIEAWHKPFHNDCKNHPTFSKCCHNFQLDGPCP